MNNFAIRISYYYDNLNNNFNNNFNNCIKCININYIY